MGSAARPNGKAVDPSQTPARPTESGISPSPEPLSVRSVRVREIKTPLRDGTNHAGGAAYHRRCSVPSEVQRTLGGAAYHRPRAFASAMDPSPREQTSRTGVQHPRAIHKHMVPIYPQAAHGTVGGSDRWRRLWMALHSTRSGPSTPHPAARCGGVPAARGHRRASVVNRVPAHCAPASRWCPQQFPRMGGCQQQDAASCGGASSRTQGASAQVVMVGSCTSCRWDRVVIGLPTRSCCAVYSMLSLQYALQTHSKARSTVRSKVR